MSKRVLMAGLAIGVGLATLQTGTAEAQWQFALPPGMWWYYGSIDGCATITQVRNPEQHPAQLRCEVKVTKVQTLCENPHNHDVNPGESATKVVFVATNQIDGNELLNSKEQKVKNTAGLCVEIDDNDCSIDPETGEPSSPLCNDAFCVNPNWHILDVLTTEFVATCTTEQCTGDDPDNPCAQTVPRDTESCACTLPAGYSVENPPVPCPDPLHPIPSCTAYICQELDADGNLTGNLCQLQ
jgi:hypothetical protein